MPKKIKGLDEWLTREYSGTCYSLKDEEEDDYDIMDYLDYLEDYLEDEGEE